jgi:hypothetical protein
VVRYISVHNSLFYPRGIVKWLQKSLSLGALISINTARPVRMVKLLNGTQNVCASDLSDRKI